VAWREDGRWKDRKDERYAVLFFARWGLKADASEDQQLGQMYELMQAIRKRQLEDSGSEH